MTQPYLKYDLFAPIWLEINQIYHRQYVRLCSSHNRSHFRKGFLSCQEQKIVSRSRRSLYRSLTEIDYWI